MYIFFFLLYATNKWCSGIKPQVLTLSKHNPLTWSTPEGTITEDMMVLATGEVTRPIDTTLAKMKYQD